MKRASGRHRQPSENRAGRLDDDLLSDVAANPELARLVHLLRAEPGEHELTGLDSAIRSFRTTHVSDPSKKRRRPSMIPTLVGAKLGATIAGVAVGLGGVATVAYVSANVGPSSDRAGHASAAASPTHATPTGTPSRAEKTARTDKAAAAVGPDATGAAAHGLCTAWQGAGDRGKAMDSVAFRNLAEAAGGEDEVEAFCAEVEAPGGSGSHPTGRPSDAPTGRPADAPTGKPADAPAAPTGKPADAPTPPQAKPTPDTRPTGRP